MLWPKIRKKENSPESRKECDTAQMTDINNTKRSQGSGKPRQNLAAVTQLNPRRDTMHHGYFGK